MKYKSEWKGRLRVDSHNGAVFWDNKSIGLVRSVRRDGAKSPGGMVTNQVWMARNNYGEQEFPSMFAALCHLITDNEYQRSFTIAFGRKPHAGI